VSTVTTTVTTPMTMTILLRFGYRLPRCTQAPRQTSIITNISVPATRRMTCIPCGLHVFYVLFGTQACGVGSRSGTQHIENKNRTPIP